MTPSKLGPWVFRVEECPKDAIVAVVNRDTGRLVWWRGEQPEKFVPLDNGHWLAKGGSIKKGSGYLAVTSIFPLKLGLIV